MVDVFEFGNEIVSSHTESNSSLDTNGDVSTMTLLQDLQNSGDVVYVYDAIGFLCDDICRNTEGATVISWPFHCEGKHMYDNGINVPRSNQY